MGKVPKFGTLWNFLELFGTFGNLVPNFEFSKIFPLIERLKLPSQAEEVSLEATEGNALAYRVVSSVRADSLHFYLLQFSVANTHYTGGPLTMYTWDTLGNSVTGGISAEFGSETGGVYETS